MGCRVSLLARRPGALSGLRYPYADHWKRPFRGPRVLYFKRHRTGSQLPALCSSADAIRGCRILGETLGTNLSGPLCIVAGGFGDGTCEPKSRLEHYRFGLYIQRLCVEPISCAYMGAPLFVELELPVVVD